MHPARAFFKRTLFFITFILFLITVLGERVTEEAVHEYAATLFAILVIYHIKSNFWQLCHLLTKKSPYFYFRTVITVGLLLSCALAVISGIFISQELFAWLNLPWGRQMRTLHNAAAVYFILLVGLHAGLYAPQLLVFVKEQLGRTVSRLIALLCVLIGIYGLYTLISVETLDKLLMRSSFAFFDYDAPKIYFFIDIGAQLIAMAVISALISRALLLAGTKRS